MSNINLCAVDDNGYCAKCGSYVRDPSYCEELVNEYAHINPDTGDYNFDDGPSEDFDIGDYLSNN